MIKRKVGILGLFAASIALAATAASTATGTESASTLAFGTCSGTWVTVTGTQAVRAEPNTTSTIMLTVIPVNAARAASRWWVPLTMRAECSTPNGWILNPRLQTGVRPRPRVVRLHSQRMHLRRREPIVIS